MELRFTVLLMLCLAGGCISAGGDSMDSFLDKHYVLFKKNADQLDGPYKVAKVLTPNTILAGRNGTIFKIVIRGCVAANREDMDLKAMKLLGTMWPENVYLHKACTVATEESNTVRSVVYTPANQNFIKYDDAGEAQFDNLTYTMPQLLNLTGGYCVLDHSDTNYPLYQVFVEAENLAKKHRQGYWATHTEPPAQAPTNAISNVTTNK